MSHQDMAPAPWNPNLVVRALLEDLAEPTGGADVPPTPAAVVTGVSATTAAADLQGLPVVPAGVRDIPDAASGHSSEAPAHHLCETCGTRPVHRSNHEVRSRWCLECQIDGSVPLPKHRFDDGPATELSPPTYCYRSFCICCGRGGEFITRERKPVQGATRCAHCNGRMIVEFT